MTTTYAKTPTVPYLTCPIDAAALPQPYQEKVTALCSHLEAPGFLGTFTGPRNVGKMALLRAAAKWARATHPRCLWHEMTMAAGERSCRQQLMRILSLQALPGDADWDPAQVVAHPTVLVMHRADRMDAEDLEVLWALASEAQSRGWRWGLVMVADQPLMTHVLGMMKGPLLSVRISSIAIAPLTMAQSVAYLRRCLSLAQHPRHADQAWLRHVAEPCQGLHAQLDQAVLTVCGQMAEDSLQSPHVLEIAVQWFRKQSRRFRYGMMIGVMLLMTGLFWAQARELPSLDQSMKQWLAAVRAQSTVVLANQSDGAALSHQLYRQPTVHVRG